MTLLERIRRDGRDADLGPEPPAPVADAEAVVAALRRAAAALPDADAALAAWDEAGSLHRPETLDSAIAELAAWRLLGFVRRTSKRRLRRAARVALRRTSSVGSLRLAAAFLGELGGTEDVDVLEALARHPRLTLHAATALSNLYPWQARLALLRLLAATSGEQRVTVIDRLLPHAASGAVRLALVRDALAGLAPEHVREVASDIAESCRCRRIADDPAADPAVREAAHAVLAAAEEAAGDVPAGA